MSAITTTPAPSIGRKPFVIGVAVLGVVTIAAVTIPNIHLTGTTAVPTAVQAQAPDALDRRDAMLAAAAAESSRRVETQLDGQARTVGHRTVAGTLATAYGAAATSVGREQVGGYHRTYTWTPAMAARNPLHSTDAREQVPGLQGHYAYGAAGSAALHLSWSDPWVPPVDNPDWTPFIRAHYYGGTVPERVVTRGD